MKIRKLQIGSFGKFNNYELELSDGFQIVYGKNEDGKTTLMAFIKMMFYSKFSRGRTIDKNMRKKYQPWDGSEMNGAIEFEHEGIEYRLQKRIGDTPSGDRIKLMKLATGESISLGKKEEIGKRFFGLDLAGFERSVFISQLGNFSPDGKNDEVAEKLMSNLVLSGEESVSQQEIMNRLNKAAEEMKSKRGVKGILVEAQTELDGLLAEKSEIQRVEEDQKDLVAEYNDLLIMQKEYKDIQKRLDFALNQSKLDQLDSLIDKVRRNIETEKRLGKEQIDLASLKAFLVECKSLMKECEDAKGSLTKLKASNIEENGDAELRVPISEEEFKLFMEIDKKENKIKNLLERLDEIFLPALQAVVDARMEHENVERSVSEEENSIHELKKLHDEYIEKKQELEIKKEEKDVLQRSFGKDENEWKSEQQLREQKIKFTQEKIQLNSQVQDAGGIQPKKNTLIPSVFVAALSIVLMIFVHPGFAAGLLLAIVMVVVSMQSNKAEKQKGINDEQNVVGELKHELEELLALKEKEERGLTEKTQQYEEELKKKSECISEIEKAVNELLKKNGAYEIALTNRTRLKMAKKTSESRVEEREEILKKEIVYLFNKYSEITNLSVELDISLLGKEDLDIACAREFRDRVETYTMDLQKAIKKSLHDKSCSSIAEYEEAYMEYASNSKNEQAIVDAQREFERKTERFLHKLSEYQNVEQYEVAMKLVNQLVEEVAFLEIDISQMEGLARGMGYTTFTLESLENERKRVALLVKQALEVSGVSLTIEELQEKREKLDAENINDKISQLHKLIKTPERSLSQVDQRITELETSVSEKQHYYECLQLAFDVMAEAADEMRRSFGPELNKKTAEIFKQITNGKYGKLLVTKDYDIAVQSGIHYREWQYLSNGTIDQAYLALRLAITELISDKNTILPLLLDDVMIQYDDERMDAASRFLSDYSSEKGEDSQVLLFTCHQHIIEKVESFNTEVVVI